MDRQEQYNAFVKAINEQMKKDREEGKGYDYSHRRIFADWLEDNDMPEEADRQRKWNDETQEAWDFLQEVVNELDVDDPMWGIDYFPERITSVEALLAETKKRLENGQGICTPFDTPDLLYHTSNQEKFWEAYEKVTGYKATEDDKRYGFFYCSC